MDAAAQASIAPAPFDDHAPVYRQIALILRERIGVVWRMGDELPSEGDLSRQFGVNRNTLRRAIGVLVEEGVLDRRRGIKLRVAHVPSELRRPKLEADPSLLFKMRPGTAFRVLKFERQLLTMETAPLLDLAPGSDAYRIDRLLLSRNEVLAYIVVHVPIAVGEKLRRRSLKHQTITSILYAKLGVRTNRVRQSIEATLADTPIAGVLGMAPGAAVLRCRYVMTDEHERPVQAATYYYPGDRFRLTIEIQTPPPDPAATSGRIENWPLIVTGMTAHKSEGGT